MKLAFAGTPDAAVPSLRRLTAEHSVVTVLTRPDARFGRRRVLVPSPVASAAAELALPILKEPATSPATLAAVTDHDVDLGVIVAFGALLREPLLSAPRLGWINLHFSLLPRWRGAAPVQRAIIAGDTCTGATIFQLDSGLDSGPILGTVERGIGPQETSGDLLAALAQDGAELLATVVAGLADRLIVPTEQVGVPTFAPKLSLLDGQLDPRDGADRLLARLRGVTPEPGAFLMVRGSRLKVRDAAPWVGSESLDTLPPGRLDLIAGRVLLGTASEPVELLTVQPAGRVAMPAVAWWRGASNVGGLTVDLDRDPR